MYTYTLPALQRCSKPLVQDRVVFFLGSAVRKDVIWCVEGKTLSRSQYCP